MLALILEMQSPRLVGDTRLSLAVFAIGIFTLLLTRMKATVRNIHLAFRWPIAALFAYCVWCMVSVVWSATPSDTVLQAGLLLISLIVALSYAEIPPVVLAQELVRVAVILAVVSWVMVPVLPHIAVLPDITWRLNGPMQHSQRLALVMGAAFVMTIVLSFKHVPFFKTRGREISAMVFLAATLTATQTRANTAFVLIICVLLWYIKLEGWKKLMAVGAAVVLAWGIVANFDDLLSAVGRDGSNTLTLTGRTVIWTNAIAMIQEHPVLGYGFSSFYSPLTQHFFSSGYVAPHAHNTWINATFETGLIGAALLSLFFLGVLFTDRGRKPTTGYAWPLMLFVMMCGLMGVVYGGKVGTFWILGVVVAAQALHQRWQWGLTGVDSAVLEGVDVSPRIKQIPERVIPQRGT